MIICLAIYIIIGILYYIVLDKGIRLVLKEDPDYFNNDLVVITPKIAKTINLLLSVFWPVSIVMLIFGGLDEKD